MKYIVCILMLFCISLIVPCSATADFAKTKIAVLDFQMQSDDFANKHMDSIVAEWFTTALVKEGRFEVVERRLLAKIFEEQKLVMSGMLDENSAMQIGKVLGVKVIISGSVIKVGEILQVNARIIDVESASIVAAESVKSPSTAVLQDLIMEMSKKISKNFPLQGYIVDREEQTVTLDLGDLAGVKQGMEFVVYREGAVIKHPKTGEVLDVEKITTGRVQIQTVLGKISKAQILHENEPGAISYAQLVSSVVNPVTQAGHLYIETTPPNALVSILNASFTYHNGIELAPGSYQLKVSAPGYESLSQWIKLEPGVDQRLAIRLKAETEAEAEYLPAEHLPVVALPCGNSFATTTVVSDNTYIRMLTSGDSNQQKEAANYILNNAIKDPSILDIVEAELLKGFKINSDDRDHIDVMAQFCEILGASGNSLYKESLQEVTEFATKRKLRKYALKGLENIN